jgi:predicted phosphodiesterase
MFGVSGERARDIARKHCYKNEVKNETRILVISDLHVPFQLSNLLEVLGKYKDKIDILIFNGDISDCQSISKYIKKYRVPFVEELIQTRDFITKVIKLINPKKVYFNFGNHEIRYANYFSEKINDDLMSLMPNDSLELLIVDGFYKRDRFNGTKLFFEPLNKVIDNIELIYTGSWYNQIGDVIFCHPMAYKRALLKTTQDAYLYFVQKKLDFNCIICSHTHQIGFYKYGDSYIYENGCLCKEMEYTDGKLYRPQGNGFMLCVLENGKFSYDKSKLIVL